MLTAMRKVVASLAAVLALCLPLAACGDDGAEPGASDEATLILDFTPNAVHTGIYQARAAGYYSDAGVDLTVRAPSNSTDAPKLLAAGRAQFAILDIHDLGLARERGVDIVGVGAIVGRPLAAVIARDRNAVHTPRDLEGGEVGVTGLPSDDAVLDSVLEASDADPDSVRRVTIGFDAVATLAAGKLDAATAFWNAEGVALEGLGVPTRVFRVDDYGAPRYPELVLATSAEMLRDDPELVSAVQGATAHGYADLAAHGDAALAALLDAVPDLDPVEQRAQFEALSKADAFAGSGALDHDVLADWASWDLDHGILSRPLDVDAAFPPVPDPPGDA
jgi:NitT/TauT family transport system substrate-binding protein/putative hydroxymethylpyrimidine transport system substrate-binding protein